MRRHPTLLAAPLAAVALLAACTDNGGAGDDGDAITVDSGDDTCVLSATTASAGDVVFAVTNSGGEVTEFYVYEDDGEGIVGEVENVGPGITRDLVVRLDAGTYVTACKPGMTGDGIRAAFTVTGDPAPAE